MMFSLCYTVSIRRNFYARVYSPIDKLCFFQLNPFSSAASANAESISKPSNHNPFAVDYLIKTLGFSPEKAFSASNYLNFHSAEKPDSVVAFLKKHGFTQEQTARIARNFPPIIQCNPHKTLLPKIEFFQSLGFSEAEVVKIFLTAPEISTRSLERQVGPAFNYIKSLFDATGTILSHFKYASEVLRYDLESQLFPNVEVLKDAGVYHFRKLYTCCKTFRKQLNKMQRGLGNPWGTSRRWGSIHRQCPFLQLFVYLT